MINLINLYDLSNWQLFSLGLVLFLLGLILGWFIWGAYKKRYKIALNERDDFKFIAEDFDKQLEACKDSSAEKDKVIELLRGQARSQKGSNVEKQGIIKDSTGIPASYFNALDSDNLQIIEGIGPKMSEYLHSNGINNWETLAGYDENYIKRLLNKEGTRYRIIDPKSWPDQAKLAADKDWKGLIKFQKTLVSGKQKPDEVTDSKVEKILIRLGILKRWKKDDLKAIEGIGPKIEKLLKEAGIKTWLQLSESPQKTLSDILEKAGKRYQLADPGTWPQQAKLAAEGKWQDLMALQDNLKGGKKA